MLAFYCANTEVSTSEPVSMSSNPLPETPALFRVHVFWLLTQATQEEGGYGLLTAFILWTLDQNLKLEPKDPWALGILVTALQGEVEIPSHVPWLLIL